MKIAVVGIGTAGILSLNHLCAWLPSNAQVVSIYDPSINILGVGESTTPRIPLNLFHSCGFSFLHDAHKLEATLKHGVKYVDWREHEIFSYIDTSSYGIHFNNFNLKNYAFEMLGKKWGDKFSIIEGKVSKIKNISNQVLITINGKNTYYDYVIDCRGYPEDYSDYTISDCLPINHCLVYNKNIPGDWDFTYHKATKNGWMFGIPLTTRQSWGYLYNDTITSREEAISDIREIFDDYSENMQLREFKFKPYYANKILDGRILKNGNRFLFFEPLEALSSFYYDEANRFFIDYINGNIKEDDFNKVFNQYSKLLENFICYIYHGGSIYDSQFWRYAKNITSKRLESDELFSFTKNYYCSVKDNPNIGEIIKPFTSWAWSNIDTQFGYNYFKNNYTEKTTVSYSSGY